MTVSISQMVADTQQFEQQQMDDFKQFIEVSKKLKGSLVSVEKQCDEYCAKMHKLVDSLAQAEANNQSPLLCLAADQAYMMALTQVRKLPADLNKAALSEAYMKQFQQLVAQEMKRRESQNE